MRTFEYRLFVNKAQSHLLTQCLRESRSLYNEMLETLKQQYEHDGTFPSKYDLTAQFKGRDGEHVPATTVQMLADRLSKTLRRKQRQLCRRKKGGQRRRKAARNTAKTHLKIKRQRRDFHFKVAKQYAECYQVIAVEQLSILNMVQNHSLAKSIMDASWDAFLDMLEVKAESAGHQMIRVNPRFTSQKCHRCGEMVQKALSVRTHICPFCGSIADRDVNAAQNILQHARPGHGLQEPTYTDGCSVS